MISSKNDNLISNTKRSTFNILITGSNGQLGNEIRELSSNYPHNFYFTDINEFDITKEYDVKKYIYNKNINLIVNCAAYTAVDKAEEEKGLADLINHKAVEHLAKVSKEQGVFLVHISTDYVFDGKNYKPYVEDDKTNPQSVYGSTKLKGEEAFINSGATGIIIRTSWLYSSFGHNFVKTMLNLAQTKKELNIIYDQIGTPTYAKDLAEVVLRILNAKCSMLNENKDISISNKVEVYHYSNEGVVSWYDFAKAIFETKGIDIKINPIETKDYPTPAKRPHYSVLNKAKIKRDFGIEIPHWRESLKKMLNGKC